MTNFKTKQFVFSAGVNTTAPPQVTSRTRAGPTPDHQQPGSRSGQFLFLSDAPSFARSLTHSRSVWLFTGNNEPVSSPSQHPTVLYITLPIGQYTIILMIHSLSLTDRQVSDLSLSLTQSPCVCWWLAACCFGDTGG